MSKENMEPIVNQPANENDTAVDESQSLSKEATTTTSNTTTTNVVVEVAPPEVVGIAVAVASKRTLDNDTTGSSSSTDIVKRSRGSVDGDVVTNEAIAPCAENEILLDLALTMNLKVGDRIEVQWEVDVVDDDMNNNNDDDDDIDEEKDDDDDEKNDDRNNDTTTTTTTEFPSLSSEEEKEETANASSQSHVHWWGATLLEHDGRMDDNVAIRTLLYDPYPNGGFTESSREDVIFMGRNILISYPSQDELNYRIVQRRSVNDRSVEVDNEVDNEEEAYIISNDDDIEHLVDSILSNALQKTSSNFQSLSRSQQIQVAETIATKKEKLIQLMKEHMNEQRAAAATSSSNNTLHRPPVTAQDALNLLARAMQSD